MPQVPNIQEFVMVKAIHINKHLEKPMEEPAEEQPGDTEEAGGPDQDSRDDPEEVQQLEEKPQTNQVIEDAMMTQVGKSERRSHGGE